MIKMKTFLIASMLAILMIASNAAPGWAQTSSRTTSLSAAITDQISTVITVGSASGITAGSTGIFIDKEYMTVTSLTTTGSVRLTVKRGQSSTAPTTHASGVDVFAGPIASGVRVSPFTTSSTGLSGSCTRTDYQYLPIFAVTTGEMFNCWNGKWYQQTLPGAYVAAPRFCNIANSGIAALTSLGVSTTAAAGTIYVSSINIPTSRQITGISLLNGGTVGTSLTVVALYDAAGNLVANSSTAGISGGTASTFWDIAFGTAYFVSGPSRMFIGIQAQGATSTFQLMGAGAAFGDIFANSRAGTLGTLPAITVPSAFTSVSGGIVCLY